MKRTCSSESVDEDFLCSTSICEDDEPITMTNDDTAGIISSDDQALLAQQQQQQLGEAQPSQQQQQQPVRQPRQGVEFRSRNVYFGKLPLSTTEIELRQLCERFGGLQSVKLSRSKDGGTMFGFILFLEEDSALRAIRALNGMTSASWSNPIEVRTASASATCSMAKRRPGRRMKQGQQPTTPTVQQFAVVQPQTAYGSNQQQPIIEFLDPHGQPVHQSAVQYAPAPMQQQPQQQTALYQQQQNAPQFVQQQQGVLAMPMQQQQPHSVQPMPTFGHPAPQQQHIQYTYAQQPPPQMGGVVTQPIGMFQQQQPTPSQPIVQLLCPMESSFNASSLSNNTNIGGGSGSGGSVPLTAPRTAGSSESNVGPAGAPMANSYASQQQQNSGTMFLTPNNSNSSGTANLPANTASFALRPFGSSAPAPPGTMVVLQQQPPPPPQQHHGM